MSGAQYEEQPPNEYQPKLPLEVFELSADAFDNLIAELLGASEDVPVAGSVLKAFKALKAFDDIILRRSIAGFLGPVSEVPQAKRTKHLHKLANDEVSGRRVGENLLLLLSQLD